jgi:hypothetical protein
VLIGGVRLVRELACDREFNDGRSEEISPGTLVTNYAELVNFKSGSLQRRLYGIPP